MVYMPRKVPDHLDRLRETRNFPERDVSMGFLKAQFKREVEKPYKQLGAVAAAWCENVPPDLLPHTRLDGLTRGVLNVIVDSSAVNYELDRVLRGGVWEKIVVASKGAVLRRWKTSVGVVEDADTDNQDRR
ncbi:MAG: DUF721 domain-containing protein [Phycisphaera sp.]|nr:DUF721 domain-containing protein [Phycisphaera sp.]